MTLPYNRQKATLPPTLSPPREREKITPDQRSLYRIEKTVPATSGIQMIAPKLATVPDPSAC